MTAEDLNESGIRRWQAKDLDGAFADFSQAIELAPKDPAAWTNRAGLRVARRQPGDLDTAIGELNHALLIESSYLPALRNLGLAFLVMGRAEDARRQFEKALESEPDDAWTLCQRGVTRGQSGDHRGALADFDRAVSVAPDLPIAWANRAEAKRELGDIAGANADLVEFERLRRN